MPEYFEALETTGIENDQMKVVSIGEQEILLAKVDDRVYAVSNICPHMKARLSGGSLKGTVITCPRHASQFDLSDGRVVRWTNWSGAKLAVSKLFKRPRALKTYPVKVEEDRIFVGV